MGQEDMMHFNSFISPLKVPHKTLNRLMYFLCSVQFWIIFSNL